MNRRKFVQNMGLGTLAFSLFPEVAWTKKPSLFTVEMLTGKGNNLLKGTRFLLAEETLAAFEAMKAAAARDHIGINMASAYRSYERQLQIWNNKYATFTQEGISPQEAIQKIIEYSTIPGTSRHHWGTDIDITQVVTDPVRGSLNERHFAEGGSFYALKLWLNQNAGKFGFYEVYTNQPDRKGFKYEPWHFSYRPLAIPMLKAYLKLDLNTIIPDQRISGHEFLTRKFIRKYKKEHILDINKALLSFKNLSPTY